MPGTYGTPGFNPKALGGVLIGNRSAVGYGVANATIPAARFVQTSGNPPTESLVSTAGATGTTNVFGVSLQAAVAGDRFEVAKIETDHEVQVETGAAISAGSAVTTDGSGRAIVASTAGHYILGMSQDAAAAAGEYIIVKLRTDYKTV